MLLTEAKKETYQVSRLNNKQDLQLTLPSTIADNKSKYLLFNTNIRKQLNFKSEQVSPISSLKFNNSVMEMNGDSSLANATVGGDGYINKVKKQGGFKTNKKAFEKVKDYDTSMKGFGVGASNTFKNFANILNQSTDNIMIRPEYQKFYDANQRSIIELAASKNGFYGKAQRNGHQSTSLGMNLRSIDEININIQSKNFTQTTYYTSLGHNNQMRGGNSLGFSTEKKIGILPSIFENYLKMNPIQSPLLKQKINHQNTIALMDQSSVLDMTNEQILKMAAMPLQDQALQEAKRKFMNTTLRKAVSPKSSMGNFQQMFTFQSKLENSIINETNEETPQNTGFGFKAKTMRSSLQNDQNINVAPQIKVFYENEVQAPAVAQNSSTVRWKLLSNLDFLDDEEDANNFDLQIPQFDPVCYCNIKGKNNNGIQVLKPNDQPCLKHDSIEGMIDLINTQFQQVQQLNINVNEEYEYFDNSIQKIVFLRGHSFYDHIMSIINEKDLEILELRQELSKLIIMKKDNEILRMHLNQMQDDQDYMKEKVQYSKQQQSMLDKLETLVKELKIQLSSKENELIDTQEQLNKKIKEAKLSTKQLLQEKQVNSELIDRIETLEHLVKKFTKENDNLRKFIDGEVNEIDTFDKNLIKKGEKLIQHNYKLNNTNVMSENFSSLEKDVENMNMIKYLALAAVDVKKNIDIGAGMDFNQFKQQ